MIGDIWNAQETPANGDYRSIAFGNGIYVAVNHALTNNNILTSPDGKTWTISAIGLKGKWRGIVFGSGKFVMTSIDTGATYQVANSTNGKDWTFHASADNSLRWYATCHGANQFVSVAWNDTTACVMTSPDGENWTIRDGIADNYWTCVTYGTGLYVAMASFTAGSGELCMTSSDGVIWTERATGISNMGWADVTWGNGFYIAVGDAPDEQPNKVGRSANGITWATISASGDAGDNWNGVVYAEELFVSVSAYEGASQVMASADLGLTWQRVTQPKIKTWRALCYAPSLGMLAAIASKDISQNNLVMTSIDDTVPLSDGTLSVSRFISLALEKK